MPNFQYTATDQTGAQTQGTFEAANESKFTNSSLNMDLLSASYSLDPPASSKSNEGGVKGQGKKEEKKVYWPLNLVRSFKGGYFCITRQMSTLVQAGLPLVKFEVMIKQQEKKPKFKDMLTVTEKVTRGNLSDGLAMYPKTLTIFINMKAGEAGGVLDLVLIVWLNFRKIIVLSKKLSPL